MVPLSLAAMQPSRISAARSFLNKAIRERWDIRCESLDIDELGEGTAVYRILTPRQEFTFIAFSRAPSRSGRTARIIGQAWDMMGTLNEGPPNQSDIEIARREIPKLYSGRATPNSLIWSRSNRSMRVFDTALQALRRGEQPRIEDIAGSCYLMRNTGLDGNGTFGTRSFPSLGREHALGAPLRAQMLNAYLLREFSCDILEHLAKLTSPDAVPLAPEIRRFIGVGNGSALGLIFFIQRHPRLISNWIAAREQSIAAACSLAVGKGDPHLLKLIALLQRAIVFRRQDRMVYEEFASSANIAADLERAVTRLEELAGTGLIDGTQHPFPLHRLAEEFHAGLLAEAYETFLSMLIELVPERADELADCLGGEDEFQIDPSRTVSGLSAQIQTDYDWALRIDMASPGAYEYVWYKSESAEEPRRGRRVEADGAKDLGFDLPGEVQQLKQNLDREDPAMPLSRFLMKYPQYGYIVARIQGLEGLPYHSPFANINAEDFVPIHLVRLMNVTVHGIDKPRDFLKRNLRGVLFHGAPTPDDIRAGRGGDWFYPAEPTL